MNSKGIRARVTMKNRNIRLILEYRNIPSSYSLEAFEVEEMWECSVGSRSTAI